MFQVVRFYAGSVILETNPDAVFRIEPGCQPKFGIILPAKRVARVFQYMHGELIKLGFRCIHSRHPGVQLEFDGDAGPAIVIVTQVSRVGQQLVDIDPLTLVEVIGIELRQVADNPDDTVDVML